MATKNLKLDEDLRSHRRPQTDTVQKSESHFMYLTSSRPEHSECFVCYLCKISSKGPMKKTSIGYKDLFENFKSTSGGIQFLGDKLVSWMSKKQDCTAMSSAEAEYEALSASSVDKSPTHYPCDSARAFRVILFSIHNDEWKSFQCHHQTALWYNIYTVKRSYGTGDGDGDDLIPSESDSLRHAHAQTTKTFYKHQDSRIMKAQELKTKTSAQTLIYKIFLQRYQVYQGRLLASFQDDAKYEHVGQDTRSQGGKSDRDEG
ncbi:hypothetical protein Tco_1485148 [Tanacetum coccineum]